MPHSTTTTAAARPAATRAAGNRLTRAGIAVFLDALTDTGMVCEAALRAGVPRASLYRRRAADPGFAAAWAGALEAGLDRLRDEAVRRARDGVEEIVWHRGEPVGTVRRYSDQLLMFLLRAHQPALYREPRGAAATAPQAGMVAARAGDAQDRLVADAYALGKDHGVRDLLDAIDGTTRNGADKGGAAARDDAPSGAGHRNAEGPPAAWPPGYAPAAPAGEGACAEPGIRPSDPP